MSGQRQSLGVRFATGDPWQPYYINPSKRVDLMIEFANSPASRRDLKATFIGDYHFSTLMRRRPAPAKLSLRFYAGWITNSAPRDRWPFAEGSIGTTAELGALRSVRNQRLIGCQIIGLHWEHDFRNLFLKRYGWSFWWDRM